ncbi:hypothetical protein [Rubripirellula reticaptiva]|uniref:Uncharacterized protein n=1 Tax=Rubripirellula reticaptiva TaxID=2528013 RepID=A0A5C6FD16_9BACT|nr:hypothetical protein [Rubripirellula reticaptiva]TWU57966.1 hypothetical protein Poly59_08750 [Rubripirellula reticaptiva]
MRRTVRFNRFVLAFLAVGVTATSACADWHTFWHDLNVGYKRNNAWPEPFNEADAMQVAAPFEIMKHNGWRIHNTIGHELFRESDGALLASGNRRVQWIATQAPALHRDVFVMRGMTPEETQARVASVHQTLASLNIQGPRPAVMVTDVEPGTSSGAWATKVSREWLNNLPSPQLPATSAGGNQSVATPSGN